MQKVKDARMLCLKSPLLDSLFWLPMHDNAFSRCRVHVALNGLQGKGRRWRPRLPDDNKRRLTRG